MLVLVSYKNDDLILWNYSDSSKLLHGILILLLYKLYSSKMISWQYGIETTSKYFQLEEGWKRVRIEIKAAYISILNVTYSKEKSGVGGTS